MVTERIVSSICALAACSASALSAELVSFSMDGCLPCRSMAPVVQQLEESGVSVRRINGSRNPAAAARLQVSRYPTFIAVDNGQEVGRIVGMASYEQLQALVGAPQRPSTVRPVSNRTFAAAPTGPDGSLATVGGDWGAGQPVAPRAAPPVAPPVAAQPVSVQPVSVQDRAAGARLLSSSVRLTIEESNGRSYGTGTIVDSRQGEALVVTCAHLFRDAQGAAIDPTGKMTIELYDASTGSPRVAERVAGQLISYDFDADVALVAIHANGQVSTTPIASSPGELRVGDRVKSVGCDLGADPTVRESRVVSLDRYDGPPNIEASGAPVQGRSGGGLFDEHGRLVGVCNFADDAADEGIYAGLASIHGQLDKIGLSDLYRRGGAASAPSTPPLPQVAQAAPRTARELQPVERTPIVRGQNGFDAPAPAQPASAPATLSSEEQATLGEIVARGERAEVVVLIRPDRPGGRTEVVTLDSASPEFVAALRRLGPSR